MRSAGSKVSMKDGSGVNKSVVNHLVNGRGGGGEVLWNVFNTLEIMTDWFIVCSREVSEFYFNLWLESVGRRGGEREVELCISTGSSDCRRKFSSIYILIRVEHSIYIQVRWGEVGYSGLCVKRAPFKYLWYIVLFLHSYSLNAHDFYSLTEHDFYSLTEHDFYSSTEHDFYCTTEHDFYISTDHDFYSSTEHDFYNSTEHDFYSSTEH